MDRCERCKKIIWPWQRSFDFSFGDFKKHLCADCMIPVLDAAVDVMTGQRNFFLNEIVHRSFCVGAIKYPFDNCEKLQCSNSKESHYDICARCWCEAARKAAGENE